MQNTSPKSRKIALILALLVGAFGVHRFYVGKIGTGILQLVLTLTFFGLIFSSWWILADWITIAIGRFKDADGLKLTKWTPKKSVLIQA